MRLNTQHIRTMYDLLNETVDKVFNNQQNFIWQQVSNEKEKDSASWNELLNIKQEFGMDEVRQDCLENGIKADQSQLELYEISLGINKKVDDFDIFSQYNNKVYTTRLLVLSHAMNAPFQKEMKRILSNDKNCKLQSAPVKQYERAVIKAQIKKGRERFPQSACVLDYLRCSVTYDSTKALLVGVKNFINVVNNGESTLLRSIARIKNGFAKIADWKSATDCQYCDIKVT